MVHEQEVLLHLLWKHLYCFFCLQLQIPFAGKFLRRPLRKNTACFRNTPSYVALRSYLALKTTAVMKKCTIGFYSSSDVISMVSDRLNTLIMVFQTVRDRSGVTMMSLSNVHLYVFLLSQCWFLMFIPSSSSFFVERLTENIPWL